MDTSALVNTPKRPRQSHAPVWWLSFQDTPDFMRDNSFIVLGYRPQLTLAAALGSVFRWHNQTMNIWSHLAGLALFVYYTVSTCMNGEVRTRWPLLVFLAGAMTCFATSALFHVMCCVSAAYNAMFLKLDFAGIVVVMWSMYWPWVCYTFGIRAYVTTIVYMAMASLVSVGTLYTAVSDAMVGNSRSIQLIRPVLFGLQAVVGVVPLVHASSMYWPQVQFATKMVVAQLLLHATGATVYSTKVPERFFPGMFDTTASSHTLFHIFIVAGFVAYYHGMLHLATGYNRLDGI